MKQKSSFFKFAKSILGAVFKPSTFARLKKMPYKDLQKVLSLGKKNKLPAEQLKEIQILANKARIK